MQYSIFMKTLLQIIFSRILLVSRTELLIQWNPTYSTTMLNLSGMAFFDKIKEMDQKYAILNKFNVEFTTLPNLVNICCPGAAIRHDICQNFCATIKKKSQKMHK